MLVKEGLGVRKREKPKKPCQGDKIRENRAEIGKDTARSKTSGSPSKEEHTEHKQGISAWQTCPSVAKGAF